MNGVKLGVGIGELTTYSTFSLQSTLHLKVGDKVNLQISYSTSGSLFDNVEHFTHFTGWLLQEDFSS